MESSALSVFPLSKAIVPITGQNQKSFGSLEEEDRKIIENIAKQFQQLYPSSCFSNKTLPSRVLLRFYHVPKLTVEELRRVNISTNRIKAIQAHLNSQTVIVELQRKREKKKIKIKPKQLRVKMNKQRIEETVDKFIQQHRSMIREADERLIRAVLEVLIRWTWHANAAEVKCESRGDNYLFSVHKVQTIFLSDLERLCDLGDYVQELQVHLKEKVIRFSVLRTSSYIADDRSKRRKTNAL